MSMHPFVGAFVRSANQPINQSIKIKQASHSVAHSLMHSLMPSFIQPIIPCIEHEIGVICKDLSFAVCIVAEIALAAADVRSMSDGTTLECLPTRLPVCWGGSFVITHPPDQPLHAFVA